MMHRLAYPRVSLTGRQLSEEAARYPAQRDATCSAGELAAHAAEGDLEAMVASTKARMAAAGIRNPFAAPKVPAMLVPDPLTKLAAEHAALLDEWERARLTIATLGQINEGLMAANLQLRTFFKALRERPVFVHPGRLQPDADTPGLYIQCDNAEHRAAIMRALSFAGPAVQPVPEPPTHPEPIPLRALSHPRQAVGLLTR